jgi:mRNA-degrading endonuclease YafQ of YafQ-DinJ toxin-antitoxin module
LKPILFTSRFCGQLRAKSAAEQREAAAAVQRLEQQLGQPHVHSGLGIRKLQRDYFELRVSRDLRLVFKLGKDAVTFVLAGNHDEVRRFLRSQ